MPNPDPQGVSGSDFTHVSCTSQTFCMGAWSSDLDAAAEQWNGTQWSPSAVASPGLPSSTTDLNGISCTSSTSCIAAGAIGGGESSFAEQWDGTSWSTMTTVNPSGSSSYFGQGGISCLTSSFCIGVGGDNGNTMAQEYGTPSESDTLSGFVLDTSGNPVAGVQVGVSGQAGNAGTTSGPDGSYSLSVPPGSYTLGVSCSPTPCGNEPDFNLPGVPLTLSGNQVENLTLPALVTLGVTVLDNGQPATGSSGVAMLSDFQSAPFTLFPGSSPIQATEFYNSRVPLNSNSTANFQMFPGNVPSPTGNIGVPPNNTSDDTFTISPSAISQNTDYTVDLATLGSDTLSGFVLDTSGNPVAGVQVGVSGQAGNAGNNFGTGWFVLALCSTWFVHSWRQL